MAGNVKATCLACMAFLLCRLPDGNEECKTDRYRQSARSGIVRTPDPTRVVPPGPPGVRFRVDDSIKGAWMLRYDSSWRDAAHAFLRGGNVAAFADRTWTLRQRQPVGWPTPTSFSATTPTGFSQADESAGTFRVRRRLALAVDNCDSARKT